MKRTGVYVWRGDRIGSHCAMSKAGSWSLWGRVDVKDFNQMLDRRSKSNLFFSQMLIFKKQKAYKQLTIYQE